MKFPKFFACARTECAGIARIALRHLADGCTQHHNILIDERNAVPPDLDIDNAILTESLRGLSRNRIDGHESRTRCENDSRWDRAFARPVSNTTRCGVESGEFVFPNLVS